ncbi:hypothetical protein [Ornithinibacillus salinisoli]
MKSKHKLIGIKSIVYESTRVFGKGDESEWLKLDKMLGHTKMIYY